MLTTIRSHTFLDAPLYTPGAVVLDLGANFGDFSMQIQRRFACRCIAVEPNPLCQRVIRSMFSLEVLPYAVTECTTEALPFTLDQWNPEASRLSTEDTGFTVPATTLDDLLDSLHLERVSLVKMDIEGAEYGVLRMSSTSVLSRIDQIAVEFHPDSASAAEIKRMLDSMEKRYGFAAFRFSRTGYGDTLLVNTERVPLDHIERLALHIARPVRGARRLTRRFLRQHGFHHH